MGMDFNGLKKGITSRLHNETDPGRPQECVGDCGKIGRENGAMECPVIGKRKGIYNAVILEKVKRSRKDSSYAEVTSEYFKTP